MVKDDQGLLMHTLRQ